MERCPVCGSETRPGAKYCTTCGTKLTEQSAGTRDAGAPNPGRTTPNAGSGDPPTLAAGDEPDRVLATAWPKESHDSTAQVQGVPPSPTWPSGPDSSPSPDIQDGGMVALPGQRETWIGDAAIGPQPETLARTIAGPDPDPTASAITAQGNSEPLTGTGPGAEGAPTTVETTESPAARAVAAPGPPAPSFTSTPEAAVIPAQPAPLPPSAAGRAPDARARTVALLDELRRLLPLLVEPAADRNAVADELAAALDADRDDWEPLRRTVLDASGAPRDIENLAAVSRQLDAILELLDRHDQLRHVVAHAVAQLRGEDAAS